MSKGQSLAGVDDMEPSAIEGEGMATAQESVPNPLGAGEFKVAGRFMSPIYGQRSQQAKNDRPGKK